jgi:drug/metabolite transporter (DMT)-like permease
VTWKQALGALTFVGVMLLVPEMAMAADGVGIGDMADNARGEVKSIAWLFVAVFGLALIVSAIKGKTEKVIISVVLLVIALLFVVDPKEIADVARGILNDLTS